VLDFLQLGHTLLSYACVSSIFSKYPVLIKFLILVQGAS
jgi:hypothetical protein